jgi:putative transposase
VTTHPLMPSRSAPAPGLQDWRDGLLEDVVRIVVEAALDAELAEHLARCGRQAPAGACGPNARNGYRHKTVRTAFGAVTISAPRDRWGTFDPVTVPKWQRRVAAVDQLAVPLAASGAERSECVALLARLYGPPASLGVAGRVVAEIERRIAPWHARALDPRVRTVVFDRVVLRSKDGRVATTPVRTAVGVTGCGQRELLSLRAAPAQGRGNGWYEAIADLHQRGARDVQTVFGPSVPGLDDMVRAVWPTAVRQDAGSSGAHSRDRLPA